MAKKLARGRTVLIAEIGVNHNGSLRLAKELVVKAAEAGADYAKFQTFKSKSLATADALVAPYQKSAAAGPRQQDLLSSLELREDEFRELVSHCEAVGVGFLTTPHDLESAEFVFGLDSDFIKIPSGDVTNAPLLKLAAKQGKPILLSTGASNAGEVLEAIEMLEFFGQSRKGVTVMQCTTEYPAPLEEANLAAMVEMGQQWGVGIGYSDHTSGTEAALAAVALGATVLEKHITLDSSMLGPDHNASMEPHEFASLVAGVRRVERALGQPTKVVTSSEAHNRTAIRKSIVARHAIEEGELFSEANMAVMRPGDGLSPMKWAEVVGRTAHKSFAPEEKIVLG